MSAAGEREVECGQRLPLLLEVEEGERGQRLPLSAEAEDEGDCHQRLPKSAVESERVPPARKLVSE